MRNKKSENRYPLVFIIGIIVAIIMTISLTVILSDILLIY